MPSALETLVKILRLEQETGYKNTTVIGGLESYLANWARDAHQQAKTQRQHALVEELSQMMTRYSNEDDREHRQQALKYMMGRITGRIPAEPEFDVQFDDEESSPPPKEHQPEIEQNPQSEAPVAPSPAPSKKSSAKPRRNKAATKDSDDTNTRTTEHEFKSHDIIGTHLEIEPVLKSSVSPKEPLSKPRRLGRKGFDLPQALAAIKGLSQPVTSLRGIGQKRAEQLANLGINTLNDLLFHFPRRYDDYTRMLPLNRLVIGEPVTAIGTVVRVTEHFSQQKRPYLRIVLEDGSGGKLQLFFFNQAYLKRLLMPGLQIVVYGIVDQFQGQACLTNPEWESVDQSGLKQGSIVPVYSLTKGISDKVMRKLTKQVLDEWAIRMPDYVPESVLARTDMVDLGWALHQIHFPEHWEYLDYARERLAFDELLLLQLGVLAKRQEWQAVPGVPLHLQDEQLQAFLAQLPYALTNAQLKAIEAIRTDSARDVPMNRLLQGDVGSGKTIVAAFALALAYLNGKQGAIMAPTSILAEQHYQSLCDLFANVFAVSEGERPVNIQLLTGATPEAQRREIYAGLEDGSIDMIVGTHALIQKGVVFADLAVAVIDEQHRFGVDERGALRGKGTNPHVLVMTATPIPRTLALTLFADLDLTVLDEMPPGRTPIETKLLHDNERQRAYSFILNQLNEGRQAFIIYPLVEASERLEAGSAVEAAADLQKNVFSQYQVGLLHGRLSPSEKDAVMAEFANGNIHVLVSTTVIEVGINVPNATVMMIEGANRFGLAQLHQLRGRVGRGQYQSYCLLLSDTDNAVALSRLEEVEKTTDGFVLAELDWKLRGPGDLLGTRQAGFGSARMDSVMDVRLVELAQQESRTIFAEDAELNLPEHALLAQRIYQLQIQETDLS